jgi:2'-5' RNA ligase
MLYMESYFIGITLPPALEAEIEAWRRRFHAPRTAPHITLIPPFQWDHSYAELAAVVQSTASRRPQFTIRGAGIGSFGKAVLFVKVEPSPELLAFQRDLAGELEQFGVPVETRPYHPHLTLATRLTPQRFQAYVEELADYDPSYEFSFTRAGIFQLIDAGRGKRWQLLS